MSMIAEQVHTLNKICREVNERKSVQLMCVSGYVSDNNSVMGALRRVFRGKCKKLH